MEQRGRTEGRGTSRPRFSGMVQRLLENAPSYESRANVDDGMGLNDTEVVPSRQPGAASVLHTRWQEEGPVVDLNRDECEELARAGFRINKDRDGNWSWWREKKHSHLWLVISEAGWYSTRAPQIKNAKWRLMLSFLNPVVPYFDFFPITPQNLLREGLTATLMVIRQEVPPSIFTDKFFAATKNLCDEAVANFELDRNWLGGIQEQAPMAVTGHPQFEDDSHDYTGGVVRQ